MNGKPPDRKHPLTVVQVVSGDLWAGAEAQMFTLARALADKPSVDVRAIVLNPGILAERLRDHGIDVSILDENTASAGQLYSGIRRILRSVQPDVVHTHRHKENILGALAARRSGGVASIRTVHGAEEHAAPSLRRRAITSLDRYAARHWQQSIVAVSRPLQQQLSDSLRRPVEFIPNGVDEALFDRTRGEPSTGEHRLHIAFAARLVPVKRVDLFIDIARLLTDEYAGQFAFHIFGSGPELDRARDLVSSRGLRGSVDIHGFSNDMTSKLAEMDGLVVTSDHEGLPMVVLEATSLGVPVISRPVGEIPAVLDEGRGGELVDSNEAQPFAAALLGMSRDPAAFRKKAAHAREHVRRNYSAGSCAERYLSLYRAVAKR